jgi:hypothetical protein
VRRFRRAAAPALPLHHLLLLGLVAAALSGCGKKGDPQPPLPRGPNAVSDLSVEQEGDDAVLTFTFPDRLLTGAPLTDLEAIEVFRVIHPSPSLTAPRRAASAGASAGPLTGGTTGAVSLPGAAERREATNERLAEEAFYAAARSVARLSLPVIAESTRGASVVYRDSLWKLLHEEKGPPPLAYAVVSVRRNGERSPLSNIVTLDPAVAPTAPVLYAAIPEEGRICLEWLPPATDVLGRPVEVGGYMVYRRILPQEEYGAPLNAKPVTGNDYVDTTAPYGSQLVYTVRATLAKNPKVEGIPAEELGLLYRDVYPPPAPTRLDALSEGSLVRLIWAPVDSADLAGYLVFRAEGDAAPVRLTRDPVIDPFFTDRAVSQGRRYRYTVRAVDRAGNQSPPSPEAVAEPF